MNLLLLLLATCAVFVAGSRDFYKVRTLLLTRWAKTLMYPSLSAPQILGVPKEAKDAQVCECE